ncbi:MAG: hypothetical protein ABR998_14180 [Gemmatimonadales bacterium]
MAARKTTNDDIVELLERQIIVELGLAGVPQRNIREIVQCDLNRVSRIVKQLKRSRTKGEV